MAKHQTEFNLHAKRCRLNAADLCIFSQLPFVFLLLPLQHALSGSRPLRINTCKQTQQQTATLRRMQKHTQKRAAGNNRGWSHHANQCHLWWHTRNQKINEKMDWGAQGAKGARLGSIMFFIRFFSCWPPLIALHACLAMATDHVTCHRTLQRSSR